MNPEDNKPKTVKEFAGANYRVELFTQKKGTVFIEVQAGQDMDVLNKLIFEQYGDFVTIEAKEIPTNNP